MVVCNRSDEAIFSTTALKRAQVSGNRGAFSPALLYDKFEDKSFESLFRRRDGRLSGIVVAKSYEAKALGISTGMGLQEALYRAPELITLAQNYPLYHRLSRELAHFLESRIPALEQYSIDEFFGDLRGWVKPEETLSFITHLQREILDRFDLPVSVAASEAKWIAKLTTDQIKPYGVRVIERSAIEPFVRHLPVESFSGVGRQMAKKLRARGIGTLGDLWHAPHAVAAMGKPGTLLYRRLRGTDGEGVTPYALRQSVGIGRNFEPVHSRSELQRRTVILSRHLAHTLQTLGLLPTRLVLQLRYSRAQKESLSTPLETIFSEQLLKSEALRLLQEADIAPGMAVDYLGLSLSRFTCAHPFAPSLIDHDRNRRSARLDHHQKKLRQKYGIDVLRWGVELSLL